MRVTSPKADSMEAATPSKYSELCIAVHICFPQSWSPTPLRFQVKEVVFVAVQDRTLSRKHRHEHGDTLIGKNSLHVSSNSVTILRNFISQVLFLPYTELESDNSEGRRLLWRLSKNNFHQTSPLKMWCVREHFHVILPRRAC